MARFFGFAIFLVVAIGAILYLTSRSGLEFNLPETQAEADDNVDIAQDQRRAVSDIDDQVTRALALAEKADDLANDLERAADRAQDNSDALLTLASTNDAAEVSVIASMEAAERARATALIARRASNQLREAATYADDAVEEAEEVTGMVLAVERSKEEADEAVEEAQEAREKALKAERQADTVKDQADELVDREANDNYRPASYSPGMTARNEERVIRRDRDGRVLNSIEDILPEEEDDPSYYDYAELGENG